MGSDIQSRFLSLWNGYYARLLTFCRSMASPDPEDDVQEIFLKVYRALPRFQERGRTAAWIYSIARNQLADRRRRPRLDIAARDDMDSLPDPRSVVTTGGQGSIDPLAGENVTGSYLESLRETDRAIAFLRIYERLRYREISEILAMPEGTVKYRVSMIRSRYRDFVALHRKGGGR